MKNTLYGPCGAKLHIDNSRAHKDDPGSDTPALVEWNDLWGTYWCVSETGECDGVSVPHVVTEWLNSAKISAAIESIEWS